jgi:hypothetical protein
VLNPRTVSLVSPVRAMCSQREYDPGSSILPYVSAVRRNG